MKDRHSPFFLLLRSRHRARVLPPTHLGPSANCSAVFPGQTPVLFSSRVLGSSRPSPHLLFACRRWPPIFSVSDELISEDLSFFSWSFSSMPPSDRFFTLFNDGTRRSVAYYLVPAVVFSLPPSSIVPSPPVSPLFFVKKSLGRPRIPFPA